MSRYAHTLGQDVDLRAEHRKTMAAPVLKPNLILKSMYIMMDLIYGFGRTLPKFKVIEMLARYPYMAWENRSYHRITNRYARRAFTDKQSSDDDVRLIEMGRKDQDNEQWHLMIVEDIMRQKNVKLGWLRSSLIPRVMAWTYHHLTRLLYYVKPAWSFAMNARFESHAEHEYMHLVEANPAWEDEPVETAYFQYYPRQKTLADLFRRIGLDERDHMNESLEEYERLTGKPLVS